MLEDTDQHQVNVYLKHINKINLLGLKLRIKTSVFRLFAQTEKEYIFHITYVHQTNLRTEIAEECCRERMVY